MDSYTGERSVRRRRSWYRRRLRIQRGLIAFGIVCVLAVAGVRGVTRLLSYRSRQGSSNSGSAWVNGDIHKKLPVLAASRPSKKVPDAVTNPYPYSVIPGGIRDADDLRRVTQHDRVVWRHYARFQYEHARLVRATEAREVYLSYRLRDRIFWTRKRMRLHPGELLLTDGKITARARCGNQISEEPKPQVSEEEPSEDVLDQPVAALEPMPALPMHSALRPPSLPAAEPLAPRGPEVFSGGFIFPYVPFGIPLQPPHVCKSDSDNEGGDQRCPPKRHKPPVVPEPSTMVLISSGIAAVYWRYRRTSRASDGLKNIPLR